LGDRFRYHVQKLTSGQAVAHPKARMRWPAAATPSGAMFDAVPKPMSSPDWPTWVIRVNTVCMGCRGRW
jgi:hypothetical protein